MELTNHQKEKASEIIGHLMRDNRGVLQGNAGVGKTTLANHIIGELPGKTLCAAPTNKAVAVIKNKVTTTGEFSTIHSALKMRMKYGKNGEKDFVPSPGRERIFEGIRNIVIDEASMISTPLMAYIDEYAKPMGCRVLYLGDNKQLNPVGELDSPVFLGTPHEFYAKDDAEQFCKENFGSVIRAIPNGGGYNVYVPYSTTELTEIIRQGAGNPIIDLSRDLDKIFSKIDNRNDVGGYIYSNDQQRVIDTLSDVNGSDELKYLAWTNNDVDRMNFSVRHRIYGRPSKIELGESLIFDSPYVSDNDNLAYYTNEEIKVEDLSIRTEEFSFPITSSYITKEKSDQKIRLKVYAINPGEKGIKNGVYIIHEDSERELKNITWNMIAACKAHKLEYYDKDKALKRFASVKYNHAITVHKSQGSTYGKTIVNIGDLNKNRTMEEKLRLFYTAVTRASDLLILYNI